MKKNLFGIFILLIVLFSIIVYADENTKATSATDLSSAPGQIQSDLTKTGQETTSAFSSVLANNIEIPQEISFLPKILFGIENTIQLYLRQLKNIL